MVFWVNFCHFAKNIFKNKNSIKILSFKRKSQKFTISAYNMKGWLLFYTFKFCILPYWIKYIYWISPLEQHHKIEINKFVVTLKNSLYLEHYHLKCICKFACNYSCKFHEPSLFLFSNDQLDFFFCIFRTLTALNFALYLLKCTGPSTFWNLSFQTHSFIFYLSTFCSVYKKLYEFVKGRRKKS